jgi:hypothetical protein
MKEVLRTRFSKGLINPGSDEGNFSQKSHGRTDRKPSIVRDNENVFILGPALQRVGHLIPCSQGAEILAFYPALDEALPREIYMCYQKYITS